MPELTKLTVLCSLFLGVLAANGNFLGTFSNLWGSYTPYDPPPPPHGGNGRGDHHHEGSIGSGKSFSSRGGYYDGDPYMMSASQRGWGGWGWDNDHQNLDLYSLLGGLSFASLLGATIIYLARRNTSGRRRRSADGLSYLEDDEIDFSENPQTKGLNIVELIDTFLDNPSIFSGGSSNINNASNNISEAPSKHYPNIHIGPGISPHKLFDSTSSSSSSSHHHSEESFGHPVH